MEKGVVSVSISPAIDRTLYIDNFEIDKINNVISTVEVPGSKGVNVALNLASCGVKSTCAGFIGGDRAEFFIKYLLNKGVLCDFIPVSYNVRTNLKLVDLKKKTYTDVNFPSGEPTDEEIKSLKKNLLELASENDFIALSGSISSKKLSHLYRDIIETVSSTGVKVTVDCGGEALFEAAKAKPYAIKPNILEFNTAFGFNAKTIEDIKNAALRVCESGIENILISLDKNGALCVLKGRAYFVYNLDVPVYNTVGAGDAFLSGFLYAKLKEKDDISCLKYAASFAQAAVSHKADFEKSLSEYEKYVSKIKVEELA